MVIRKNELEQAMRDSPSETLIVIREKDDKGKNRTYELKAEAIKTSGLRKDLAITDGADPINSVQAENSIYIVIEIM